MQCNNCFVIFAYCVVLIASGNAYNAIETSNKNKIGLEESNYGSQHQPSLLTTSSENDDDYLSQKEFTLEKSYHGLIRENETLVEIIPLIKVDEEKICNFRILKKPYHEIPFQLQLINNLGILRARHTLNCEKRKSYHFEIVAVFCDGTHSAPATVHVTVIDVNEYAPIFLQPSYVTEVDEGRLYNEIIRVKATDKDCTPLFGGICKYEILNNDQPFAIDNGGSIRNVEALSFKASHNHILSVVAYDCAMKQSAPIMVSIRVRRVCETKFIGIPERIDYTVSSEKESLSLFPNAELQLCDMYCDGHTLNVHTAIALKTAHISFGCDRDVRNCSNNVSLVNLLPRGVEWTKDLNFDEGSEPIFHFDGMSGVFVPDTVVTQHDFFSKPFTIVTIFRHFNNVDKISKHVKEHILCSADDHKMNRHHMALFVRNCRLILLLRKNFNEGDLNIFSPAEWRWKIPQVCDSEWHHYVLNIDQTYNVELYIDGELFESSMEDQHSNPEIIDDWPLHAAHGVNTTLTIGACYQSAENRLKHGFNGDISEIKLSLGRTLTAEDVKCGTFCAEHLLPPPEGLLQADSQVQTNTQLNEIFIEGQSKDNIDQLIRSIQYINSKKPPTIGRRNVELRTTIMCEGKNSIRLPLVETYIMVNEAPATLGVAKEHKDIQKQSKVRETASMPGAVMTTEFRGEQEQHKEKQNIKKNMEENKSIISITGNSNNLVSYTEIKRGVHILNKINITISTTREDELLSNSQLLDMCSVLVFPSLNPDHEQLEVDGDESLSTTLDIKTSINKDGVEMVGKDEITNYLDVLKALVYSNKKPAYYLNRVFKLSCSQLDTQYKSSEFTLTLTVLHPKQQVATKSTSTPVADTSYGSSDANSLPEGVVGSAYDLASEARNLYSHAMVHSHDIQEPKLRTHTVIHKAVENYKPTVLVALVCVSLVIIICGVSIARFKTSGKQNYNEQQCPKKIAGEGLIWDDSALTITINPIQAEAMLEETSDSENSDSDCDDEEVTGRFGNANQLEWDNSNMFASSGN